MWSILKIWGNFFIGQNVTRGKLKGYTLTEVIFEGVQKSKLMISVNQTWRVDEKNGIIWLFSMSSFWDIGTFRSKKGKKCADVSIFELVFIKNRSCHQIELSVIFSKMVWFTMFWPTVVDIFQFEWHWKVKKKVLSQQFFEIFKFEYLNNGGSEHSKPYHFWKDN